MKQARIVDVHRYYRTGGIDWGKLVANFDGIIISAGVGMAANPLLKEQVDGANDHDIPYMTYHIPSPNYGMAVQAKYYLSLYGVRDAWTCGDLEPPDGKTRCINDPEAHIYLRTLEDETKIKPLVYTNPKIIREVLKYPSWLKEYKLWLAQWLYQYWWLFRLYRMFEPFLVDHANQLPPFVMGTAYKDQTVLWQITCKGDAQTLCASYKTNDPIYQYGINEADLNLSTIDGPAFLDMMDGNHTPVPPPPIGQNYLVSMIDRNIREIPNAYNGKVLFTLHRYDTVEINDILNGFPGQWGKVISYSRNGIKTFFSGYVYMANLLRM